jgi:sugar lactone lactonase YvrE
MGASAEMEVLAGTQPPSPEDVHSSNGVALFNPCGLAVSTDGVIYIADTGHHRICMLVNGVLSVLAGAGSRGCADGKGKDAMFAHPCGLAISPEGYLYVAVSTRTRAPQRQSDLRSPARRATRTR